MFIAPEPTLQLPAGQEWEQLSQNVVKNSYQTPGLFHYRSTFRAYLYRNEALRGFLGQTAWESGPGMILAPGLRQPSASRDAGWGVNLAGY
jgi:hypothetical protein